MDRASRPRWRRSCCEAGAVDAVLAMAPDPADRWKPVPVIVTDPEDMARCRGMRMGYAPAAGAAGACAGGGASAHRGDRHALPGLRAARAGGRAWVRRDHVIGTPCSDNTTTERFHQFLGLLDERPETVTYLEFRADYHVELRFDDGRAPRLIPFLKLPISDLPADFFPMTCRPASTTPTGSRTSPWATWAATATSG